MIKGSIVNLVPPLCSDGSPDFDILELLIDWHIANGSAALLIANPVGQITELSQEERCEMLKRAIWQADRRIGIIANLDDNRHETIYDLARAADEFGADAAILTLPTAMGLSQDDLCTYLKELAVFAQLPFILRDNFSHPNLLSPISLASLAEFTGIAGFVDDSINAEENHHLYSAALAPRIALYSGQDNNACQLALAGYQGCVSLAANIAPALVGDMLKAAQQRNQAVADTLNYRLQVLTQALMEAPQAAAIKWALLEMGCIPENEQAPMLPQASHYANLRRALRTAQLLM